MVRSLRYQYSTNERELSDWALVSPTFSCSAVFTLLVPAFLTLFHCIAVHDHRVHCDGQFPRQPSQLIAHLETFHSTDMLLCCAFFIRIVVELLFLKKQLDPRFPSQKHDEQAAPHTSRVVST